MSLYLRSIYFKQSHSFTHSLCRDHVEVVVKVFAKHDSSLNLKSHENKLHGECACVTLATLRHTKRHKTYTHTHMHTPDIRMRLNGVGNALPFQRFWVCAFSFHYFLPISLFSTNFSLVCVFNRRRTRLRIWFGSTSISISMTESGIHV